MNDRSNLTDLPAVTLPDDVTKLVWEAEQLAEVIEEYTYRASDIESTPKILRALIALITTQAARIAGLEAERDHFEAERHKHQRRAVDAETALAAEREKVAKLVEALQIAKSIFDTPVARRRLGIDPNTDERLIEFRATLTQETDA